MQMTPSCPMRHQQPWLPPLGVQVYWVVLGQLEPEAGNAHKARQSFWLVHGQPSWPVGQMQTAWAPAALHVPPLLVHVEEVVEAMQVW